jgi:N-formylglutamate amidohydrolase
MDGYCVSEEILGQEILKLTDCYTDDLFENETDTSIKAPFSRIFCDTERFSDDKHEIMSQHGMGVLYEKTDTGSPLRRISPELRQRILDNYYWKHHTNLSESVSLQLEQLGSATIVDCHSFPSKPLIRALDQSSFRPDFNIGTDDYHTPQKWIDASIRFFKAKGFTLGVDHPYSGTMVPMQFYKKNKKVKSIMLEINRKLYLNEPANKKSIRYPEIKQIAQEFLNTIRNL